MVPGSYEPTVLLAISSSISFGLMPGKARGIMRDGARRVVMGLLQFQRLDNSSTCVGWMPVIPSDCKERGILVCSEKILTCMIWHEVLSISKITCGASV